MSHTSDYGQVAEYSGEQGNCMPRFMPRAGHFSCFWEKLFSVARPWSPWLSGGYSFRCVARARVSRRRSPVISGTSGDLNTGRETAERERRFPGRRKESCVITVLPGQNWSEGSAGGAWHVMIMATCPGNWEYICHVPWEPAPQHQSSPGGRGGPEPKARSFVIQTEIIQSSEPRRNSHWLVIT